MKKLSLLTLLILTVGVCGFSQDNLWEKAVTAWEATKEIKPTYCFHAIDAGAKGYASDYNKAAGNLEGNILYQENGKYKINVVKFMSNGEVFETEGKPTKDSYNDLQHTKENLIFAKNNQQYLSVESNKDEDDNIIPGKYTVFAKIPNYEEFSVNVTLNRDNGMPEKVVNLAAKSSKNVSGSVELNLIYQNIDGKLLVEQYIEKSKLEFYGNAVYQFDAFVFSQYK